MSSSSKSAIRGQHAPDPDSYDMENLPEPQVEVTPTTTTPAPVKIKTEKNKKVLQEELYVVINVRYQGAYEMFQCYKLKRTSNFQRMKLAFCKKFNLDHRMRFLYDGDAISSRATPQDLEMEDGDEVEVFSFQESGSGSGCGSASAGYDYNPMTN